MLKSLTDYAAGNRPPTIREYSKLTGPKPRISLERVEGVSLQVVVF